MGNLVNVILFELIGCVGNSSCDGGSCKYERLVGNSGWHSNEWLEFFRANCALQTAVGFQIRMCFQEWIKLGSNWNAV